MRPFFKGNIMRGRDTGRNPEGFGLISAMMAMGLMTIVSLMLAEFAELSGRLSNSARMNGESQVEFGTLETFLQSPLHCQSALAGATVDLDNLGRSNPVRIMVPGGSGEIFAETGTTKGLNLIYNNVSLVPESRIGINRYVTDLKVKIKVLNKTIGSTEKNFQKRIVISTRDDSGTSPILACGDFLTQAPTEYRLKHIDSQRVAIAPVQPVTTFVLRVDQTQQTLVRDIVREPMIIDFSLTGRGGIVAAGGLLPNKWYYVYAIPRSGEEFDLVADLRLPMPAIRQNHGPTGFSNAYKYMGALKTDSARGIIPFIAKSERTFTWIYQMPEIDACDLRNGGRMQHMPHNSADCGESGTNTEGHEIELTQAPETAIEVELQVIHVHKTCGAACGGTTGPLPFDCPAACDKVILSVNHSNSVSAVALNSIAMFSGESQSLDVRHIKQALNPIPISPSDIRVVMYHYTTNIDVNFPNQTSQSILSVLGWTDLYL